MEGMDVVRKMETPQIPWSSRTVEWQSSQLNALELFDSRSKLCPFLLWLGFVHVSIIICSLDFVHILYNMCIVSWSLLYEPFCCLINHTFSVAR